VQSINARDGKLQAGLRIDSLPSNVIVSEDQLKRQVVPNLMDAGEFVSATLSRAEEEERATKEARTLKDKIIEAFDVMAAGYLTLIEEAKVAVLNVLESDVQAQRFVRNLFQNVVTQDSIENIAAHLATTLSPNNTWTRVTQSLHEQEVLMERSTHKEMEKLTASILSLLRIPPSPAKSQPQPPPQPRRDSPLKSPPPQPQSAPLMESSIVSDSKDFSIFMSSQLKKRDISVTKYELLYQESRDGFKSAEFHKRCDK
jgi:hypothetical protein